MPKTQHVLQIRNKKAVPWKGFHSTAFVDMLLINATFYEFWNAFVDQKCDRYVKQSAHKSERNIKDQKALQETVYAR